MKKNICFFAILFIFVFCVSSNLNRSKTPTEIPTTVLDSIAEPIEEVEEKEEIIISDFDLAVASMSNEMRAIENIENKMEWFLAYKNIIDKYSDILDSPENIYDCFNDDELNYLFRCVETECYQADFESKSHVASVVFNRIEHEKFGDNMRMVITAPNQFAYWRKNISEDTILACEYAYMIEDATKGSVGFHSNKKTDTFNGWKYVFTDRAGHHFYK